MFCLPGTSNINDFFQGNLMDLGVLMVAFYNLTGDDISRSADVATLFSATTCVLTNAVPDHCNLTKYYTKARGKLPTGCNSSRISCFCSFVKGACRSLWFGLYCAYPARTACITRGTHELSLLAGVITLKCWGDHSLVAAAVLLLSVPGLVARMQKEIWKVASVFSKTANVTSTALTEINQERNKVRRAVLQSQTAMIAYC